ncbi:unnamed protein product [Anisakis simplex]|uniref:Uncharacterized protein n=1 Tax=Anisakis simplex TaxID=6269 RepID=A0A3P6PZT8_ANISI|nr:unnamed protein product [Anisakis simplex]
MDSLRELNCLPCGMVVYLAIGYDWANEREMLIRFENIYRHIISTLKKMLLAGYKPVDELQQQSKSSQGWYDVPVEMRPKRSCKKRALQRCDSRLWMPPPRIVLITIPNDVGFDQFVERIHNSLGNKSAILS